MCVSAAVMVNSQFYQNICERRRNVAMGTGCRCREATRLCGQTRAKSNSWSTHSSQRTTQHSFTDFQHTSPAQAHISCDCLSSYLHTLHYCVAVVPEAFFFLFGKAECCSHFASADLMRQVRSSSQGRVWAFLLKHMNELRASLLSGTSSCQCQ